MSYREFFDFFFFSPSPESQLMMLFIQANTPIKGMASIAA